MAAMTSSLRGTSLRAPAPFKAQPARGLVSRKALLVEANRKVQKKTKIILTSDVQSVGKEGEIRTVPLGYWRNFLAPRSLAKIASQGILDQIKRKKEDEIRAKLEEKAQAQAFANALSTIGKFILKKKVGDKDQIYGSVQNQEIADAIYQQTGRNVSDYEFTVPEIKSLGTYECSIKVHPEVTGTFSVVIQREKALNIVSKPEAPSKKKK